MVIQQRQSQPEPGSPEVGIEPAGPTRAQWGHRTMVALPSLLLPFLLTASLLSLLPHPYAPSQAGILPQHGA